MKTLVLLGVGSTYFTRGIVESLVEKGGEWDVRLVDIDAHCLDIAMRLAQKLVDAYKAPITISGSMDRRDVLTGANAVVSTIGVGGRKAWLQDILMPREFNIYQSTGDTYGAGGVSRALRTIPALIEIARDIEQLCPQALLVNFSNPMSVNCRALAKMTNVNTIGLCYGVTYYEHFLANYIGVPFEETSCRAIGVNHFTWITDFMHNGMDAWPLVRKKLAAEHPQVCYTWELFRQFDAYPCVGDGHICEFVPGWQGKGAYYGKTFGIDCHETVPYHAHWDQVFEDMEAQADGRKPLERRLDTPESMETFRDEELFIDVLNASQGQQAIFRTVNLPNIGQAANLPQGRRVREHDVN